ncbi:aminoglycoside phosphotransferase family protein [Frankia sp. B2]|nr:MULTISPECIES: aminoglycoside phosphotransferase family protein [unclassified Frankia]OHV50402.1 aminoglycoside phosphotransferase [Frankia sp. CgIS1]TFE32134.1 aminoglycoside phosphotransferase family protein [Frankia sp. B2]
MDESEPLLAALMVEMAATGLPARTSIRAWVLSSVERVSIPGGGTAIFKHAREPFTGEADVLQHLQAQGLPIPRILAEVRREHDLGMLLEDLGEPVRDATEADGAAAAVTVHAGTPPAGLTTLDRAALAALPGRARASLDVLRARGRWVDAAGLDKLLERLAGVAFDLADGAETPPFGLCHSEFHPTSVHIGLSGWRLLDWARAFVGPGLLDLASWQGTTGPADLTALQRLIQSYIRAGGTPEAATPRAGLPAAAWAMGWHRLWIISWYLEQATTWINDPSQDPFVESVVRRHLNEAALFLGVTMPSP